MKRFSTICNYTFQQEISIHNKEAADKLQKEMQTRYDEMHEEQKKMIEMLTKELERTKQEEENRKQRRRKMANNNPRFAEKTCWGCGVMGHLIYWCPEMY